MAWQMEQKIPQCFRLIGGTKSLSKNRCSPHENAKIPTLLPRVAIFNLTKLSLMVTWYLIMDNRVEMAPIILWFWLKSNFSPTTGGDYNECNIISWTFDQTATCILVTWLVYIESELHWIVNAPLSPDQRDHRAGSQLKNDITCANHVRRIPIGEGYSIYTAKHPFSEFEGFIQDNNLSQVDLLWQTFPM